MTIVLDRESGKLYHLTWESSDIVNIISTEISYDKAVNLCRAGEFIKVGDLSDIMDSEEKKQIPKIAMSSDPEGPPICELCGRKERYCICGGFWYCPYCDLGDVEST